MTRSFLSRPIDIPKPILYYDFNNESVHGSVLSELIGTGDNGTIPPLSVVTGQPARSGEAFHFDGTNGAIVSIPDSAIQTPHQGATGTSTWHVVVEPQTNIIATIVAKQFSTFVQEFTILVNGPSVEVLTHVGGVGQKRWISVNAIPLNVYFSITAVWDNNAILNEDKVRISINGDESPTTFALTGSDFASILDTTAPLEIGGRSIDQGNMVGSVSEFAWWSTVLTDAQIKELSSRNLRGNAVYNPPPITDYSIWWSAKNVDGVGNATLDPDPRVGLWKNLGSLGAAGDAVQATAASKPILVPSRNTQKQLLNDVITHRHGVKFDGVDDNLAFTSQSFGDFTMLSVVRPAADRGPATAHGMIVNSSTSASPYSFAGIGGLSGFLPHATFSVTGVDTVPAVYASGTSDPGIVVSSNKLSLLTMRLGGKNLTTRIDGVDKKTEDQLVQSGGVDSAAQRSLINVDNIGGAVAWGFSAFTIFDTFIFSRALSDEEIILMERFLSEEYPGVEGSFLGFGSAK